MLIFKEILSGVIIGILSGFFGLGGSSIATPILRTFADVKPLFALATPLLTVIPSSISASLVYYKKRLINFKIAKLSIISGLPFVIFGAYITKFFSGKFLMIATAIFVFVVGFTFMFRRKMLMDKSYQEIESVKLWAIMLLSLIGFFSGFLANGGGIMLVPLYVWAFKMNIKTAFGTSLFVVSFFAIPGALTHFILGHIDLKLFLILSLTAIPFANLSARVAVKLKNDLLESAYGVFLTLFAFYFFIREI